MRIEGFDQINVTIAIDQQISPIAGDTRLRFQPVANRQFGCGLRPIVYRSRQSIRLNLT